MRFAAVHPMGRWFFHWKRADPAELEQRFQRCVSSSKLHLWQPGDPIRRDIPYRLLICIGPWSLYDLRLLDEVNAKLSSFERSGGSDIHVDVFSAGTLRNVSESSLYYPNFKIATTPVVGLWEFGVHRCTRVGAELIQDTFARI
jgi:hypothetical protein